MENGNLVTILVRLSGTMMDRHIDMLRVDLFESQDDKIVEA